MDKPTPTNATSGGGDLLERDVYLGKAAGCGRVHGNHDPVNVPADVAARVSTLAQSLNDEREAFVTVRPGYKLPHY